MNVLVLNVGSSTLKFQLITTSSDRWADNSDVKLARGQIERIGGEAIVQARIGSAEQMRMTASLRDQRAAVDYVIKWLAHGGGGDAVAKVADIHAVGHRVVHGGERFQRSTLITDDVLRGIEDTIDLAPLHNPHNLKGIQAARSALGAGVPQVAVFDTAFHHTIPEHAYLYAIPYQFYRRHKVRRYGFHGTSHRYVAYRYRQITKSPREKTKIVTLHLGNGCSACAIDCGQSVDTSMGFTPLEGLVMGTRSGDVDPAVLDYIAAKEGLALHDVEGLLNKQSGLLGISGLTNDMRELVAEADELGDRRARLAIDIFCYRARKYVGSYLAAMGGADAIVFAGGIGENSARVRQQVCEGLEWFGLTLDAEANAKLVGGREGRISSEQSRLAAWVIPTDEELLIARDTFRAVEGMEARY